MRTYEMMVVIDPSPDMDKIDQAITRIEEMITGKKGKILLTDRWGRRRLAYEIQHRQYGYYTLFTFEIDPREINDMNRTLRLNSIVLRHLILVLEPKIVELALSKQRKSEEEAAKKPVEEVVVEKPEDLKSEDVPSPSEEIVQQEDLKSEDIPPPPEEIVQPEEAAPFLEIEPLTVELPQAVEEIPLTEESPVMEEPPTDDEPEIEQQESEESSETDSEEDKA